MPFATKQRLLLGLAVLLMCIPTILYSAGLLGRAPLFEGDVRKEMTCLTCNGLGRSAEKESCDTCRGRGVADFIIPGPNRPIQMIGTVTNAAGEKVAGAEVGARQAQGDETELLLKTNGDGQFGIKLPPGQYVLRVTAQTGESTQESVTIEQVSTPLPARSLDTLHTIERDFRLAK